MREQDKARDDEIEQLIHEATRKLGWIVPDTVEDVKKLEEELEADPVELPESLKDPKRLLESRRSTTPFVPPATPSEVKENLAQAARCGSEISDETMEAMEQDREEAEKQLDEQAEEE